MLNWICFFAIGPDSSQCLFNDLFVEFLASCLLLALGRLMASSALDYFLFPWIKNVKNFVGHCLNHLNSNCECCHQVFLIV